MHCCDWIKVAKCTYRRRRLLIDDMAYYYQASPIFRISKSLNEHLSDVKMTMFIHAACKRRQDTSRELMILTHFACCHHLLACGIPMLASISRRPEMALSSAMAHLTRRTRCINVTSWPVIPSICLGFH